MEQHTPTDLETASETIRARIAQRRETRTHRGAPMAAALWAAAWSFYIWLRPRRRG